MLIRQKKLLVCAGFTLIELIISMGILAMITTIFLANFHGSNKTIQLNMVKQTVASDMRLAQNYSLGSKGYAGDTLPKGGWGIHFELSSPDSYFIFPDNNDPDGNRLYDPDEEKYLVRQLPAGITLDSIEIIASDFSYNGALADIVFLQPDPTTYINQFSDRSVKITLKENVQNTTATILVNYFGLIDVTD